MKMIKQLLFMLAGSLLAASASALNLTGTYIMTPTYGSINGSTINVSAKPLSAFPSTTDMMNQGFRTADGKFAMKMFHYGSGYGFFQVLPHPDHYTVVEDDGSAIESQCQQQYSGLGTCDIFSYDAQHATIIAVWDTPPTNLTYQCDDYCMVSTLNAPIGIAATYFTDSLTGPNSPYLTINTSLGKYGYTANGLLRLDSASGYIGVFDASATDRPMVKTVSSDYTGDFIATLTVSRTVSIGSDLIYFGFGAGTPNPHYFNEPYDSIVFRIHELSWNNTFVATAVEPTTAVYPPTDGSFSPGLSSSWNLKGTTFQIKRVGNTLTLSIPAQNKSVSYDLSKLGLGLDSSNSYIFFGNSSIGTTFSNFSVEPLDRTPPKATPTQDPAGNSAGWNHSDVTVNWNWTDAGSGIDPANCTTSSISSGEGDPITLTATCKDKAGNVGTATYQVRVDETPPNVSARVSPAANAYGWNNTNVKVTFNCWDPTPGSGLATCSSTPTGSQQQGVAVAVLGQGADQSASGYATDNAGNSGWTSVDKISIDETPPTVTFSGNAGTYTVDQAVNITCSAQDQAQLSGIASDTCKNVAGPAYSFNLGANSVSATAKDKAGNTGSGSTSFTVKVTAGSLCALTQRFETKHGVANSLCVKLRHGSTGAYLNEVSAQSGKSMTSADADILTRLANAL